ncbi:MAG: DUF4623 domain-containing protein [Bacteroides sp.]|nr:DUF4623 domain-containing protein [Bacteroides sp.]
MKTTLRALFGISLLLTSAFIFNACKPEDDPEPKEALITAFKITNAGAEGNAVVDGAIDGTNILVAVPYETDLTILTVEVTVSEGANVVPTSGSTLDFTNPRNFVVTNGDLSNTYQVTVERAEPTNPVLTGLSAESASTGEDYEVDIDIIAKTITITLNNLQSKIIKISNVQVLPAGTTWEVSPVVAGTDTIDLDASPVMTLSFAGSNSEYEFVANVTQAGFNPENTSVLIDKSSASGFLPSVINSNESRGATFNGQYVVVPTRKEGNNMYYWDVEAGGDQSSMSMDGVSGGLWVISDAKFVGDAVYGCNMVNTQDQLFKVYKWDNVADETPEVILEWVVGEPVSPAVSIRLGDALSIVGDPATNGYIIASNFPFSNPQNQFYVWGFTDGVPSAEPAIWTVNPLEGARIGQYGRINQIPGESDLFLVSGAEMGIAVINLQGEVLYEIPDAIIPFRAYDPNVFLYNDGRYLTYTINKEWLADGAYMQVVNITDGADIVEALQALTDENITSKIVYTKVFGNIADVWISAGNEVAFSTEGKPRVMGFTVLNGFIVLEFSN